MCNNNTNKSCGTSCYTTPIYCGEKKDQSLQFGNISLPIPYLADKESGNCSAKDSDDDGKDKLGEPVKLALLNTPAKAACSNCSVQILVDYCKKGKTGTCQCDKKPIQVRPQTVRSFKSNCSICGIPFNVKKNVSEYHKDCVNSSLGREKRPTQKSPPCCCKKSNSSHGGNSKEVLIRKYNYAPPCQRRSNNMRAPKTCMPKPIPNSVQIDCSKKCKNASTSTDDREEEKKSSTTCSCSSSSDDGSISEKERKKKEKERKKREKEKEKEKKKKEKEKKKKKEKERKDKEKKRKEKEKERKKREKERKKNEKAKNKDSKSSLCKSRSNSECCSMSDEGDKADKKNKTKCPLKKEKESKSTQKIEIVYDSDKKKWKQSNTSSSRRKSDDESSCCSRGSEKEKKNKMKSKDKNSQTEIKDKNSRESFKACKRKKCESKAAQSTGNVCTFQNDRKNDDIRATVYYGKNAPFGCGPAEKQQSCSIPRDNTCSPPIRSFERRTRPPICYIPVSNRASKRNICFVPKRKPLSQQNICYQNQNPAICFKPHSKPTSKHSFGFQNSTPPPCRALSECSKLHANNNYGVDYSNKFDELCRQQLMDSNRPCTFTVASVENIPYLQEDDTNQTNQCWDNSSAQVCDTCTQMDNQFTNPIIYSLDIPASDICVPADICDTCAQYIDPNDMENGY